MKTAYELAMERLNKVTPAAKLTAGQKRQLAELESKYAARTAEREITLKDEITRALSEGKLEEIEKLQQRLAEERRALQAELEQKKEQVRAGKG